METRGEVSLVSPALQAVYEDWKHPAFKEADFYKRVFEEGLKVHGEEPSIQCWNEKRAPFLARHEEKIKEVEKTLQSPILGYLSPESKELALKAAFEDPDRALNSLTQLQDTRQREQEEKAKASAAILRQSLDLQKEQGPKRQNEGP